MATPQNVLDDLAALDVAAGTAFTASANLTAVTTQEATALANVKTATDANTSAQQAQQTALAKAVADLTAAYSPPSPTPTPVSLSALAPGQAATAVNWSSLLAFIMALLQVPKPTLTPGPSPFPPA